MYERHDYNGLAWIDLESPTHEDARRVIAEFGVDHLIAEELLLPSAKPRAEFHGGYVYLVLHFPALRHTHTTREQEIDFIIGKQFIITTRYDTIDPLHKFSKVFEVSAMLDTMPLGDHAGFIFFYMLKRLYKSTEHELEYVRRALSGIEERIFSEHESEMVAALSHSARDLLNMRQTIEPHREILHTLEESGPAFFGADFNSYLRALSNEYYRLHNHVMRETERLHELRETNNSLLTTKQNETMKRFTVMAFFTFPLTLIATVLGIDSVHNPIRGLPGDFWIIVAIVLGAALGMFLFFRIKRWL